MTALPILPHEAENAIGNWAIRMQMLIQEAESIANWAEDTLTEAHRTGEEPILIQGTTTNEAGEPVVVVWTEKQLASIAEMYGAAADFAAFMRQGGKNSPLRRLQRIGRPVSGGGR